MANLSAGIGELCVSRCPDDTITAVGLGSCVATVLFDPVSAKIGVVHCMLPRDRGSRPGDPQRPARYVDVGIPALVGQMSHSRAGTRRLVAAIVGGAAMFEFTGPSQLDIGRHNISVTRSILEEYEIPIVAADTGGSQGRSLNVNVGDANVTVRRVGRTKPLVCLRDAAEKIAAA